MDEMFILFEANDKGSDVYDYYEDDELEEI